MKLSRLETSGLISLLAGLICVGGCAREPEESTITLRLQYEIGDTLRYEYVARGTATYPASDDEEPRTSEYERRLSVDEVATGVTPNGNYLIDWMYHLPQKADVASAADSPTRDVTLNLEITSQGRIVEVSNIESAKSVFGDMDFRTYLEQTQPVFPERPLAIGDSWTQHVRVVTPATDPVVTTSNYVLDSVIEMDGEPVAVIAFDGDVYLPSVYRPGGEREMGASEERIRVRGKMYFAYDRGVTRKVEMNAKAAIVRVAAEDGQVRRKTLRIDQESSLELIEP